MRNSSFHIERTTRRALGAIALLCVLTGPTLWRDMHVFFGHGHEVCTRSDTHLHETPDRCDICAITLFPFLTVVSSDWSPLEIVSVYTPPSTEYSFLYATFNGYTSDRGPPVFTLT